METTLPAFQKLMDDQQCRVFIIKLLSAYNIDVYDQPSFLKDIAEDIEREIQQQANA